MRSTQPAPINYRSLLATLHLLLALCLSSVSYASEKPARLCAEAVARPCIGLVLGGGGAKGAAHVGVLKALEEYQIPVDIAVGTSVGSFVAGLHASGKSTSDIEQAFAAADWNRGYQDDLPRSQIPNRRKRHQDAFPIQLGIGLDEEGFKLPKGVIQGRGMRALIDEMLGTYPKFESFNLLPIPYRAVAADLETGEQVVLDKGDLGLAMQASMSIPGVIRPTEIDGRVLVDGGIANNLPVNVAKTLGADVIIAVDIGAPTLTREEIQSSVEVLGQMSNFLTKQNQDQARALLTDKDVLIRPVLGEMSMLDFDQMRSAVSLGYQAAMSALAEHRELHQLKQKTAPQNVPEPVNTVDVIEIDNQTRLSDHYLLARMQLDGAPPYSREQIDRGIERLFGQGTIASVTGSRQLENGQMHLTLTIEEKEWGPGYLDFEFSFEDNFRSFSLFEIGASYRYTNLNPYGAEWETSVIFGTEKSIKTELYWPLNTSGVFLEASTELSREVSNYSENNQNFGEIIRSSQTTFADIGYEFSDNFDLRLGVLVEDGRLKLPSTLSTQIGSSEIRYNDDAVFSLAAYDSLDDPDFSREGARLTASVARTRSRALEQTQFADEVEIEASIAYSLGAHSVKPLIRFASAYNDQQQIQLSNFELGGFLNLSGNDRDFIAGPHLRFARLVYTYELAKNPIAGTKLPMYLGASYEAGNVWERRSDISWGSLISSGALFLGWASPIGPAFFGYGRSENNRESLYISLGQRF